MKNIYKNISQFLFHKKYRLFLHFFFLLMFIFFFSVTLLKTSAQDKPTKEGYTIKDKNFLPLRFYVGDIVELRLIVNLTTPQLLTSPSSMELPQSAWLLIKQVDVIQIIKTQYEIRIFFVAFKPGNHLLPPINLGKITLTGLTLDTRSILDDKKIAIPVLQPKTQILLPGTRFTIGMFLFFIMLLPYLIILTSKFGKKLIIGIQLAAIREQPRIRILKNLKKIKHDIPNLEPKFFFNQLVSLLKEFMNDMLQLPVQPATTTEVKQILYRVYPNSKDSKYIKDLIAFFKTADYVRFGDKPIKKKEMNSLIDTIIALVGMLDKLEDNNHVEL